VSDDQNELHISKKYFASDLEKGITNIRSSWRAENGLSEDSTVIFFAPGNERTEAEFCVENVRRGIKEFLLKYSAPTSLSPKAHPLENFATVISLHSGSEGEQYVREYLRQNKWHGKLIIVTEEGNEHYNAMCASD
jgi:hypothetical protein